MTTPKNSHRAPSEILERQPPCNLDAEKDVLGSILLLPQVCDEVAPIVRPEDFYDDANRKIYSHLLAMRESGEAIDLKLLVHRLRTAGEYEAIGGATYLAEISRSVPTATHAKHYAGIVAEMSARRRLRFLGEHLIQASANGKPPSDAADDGIRALTELKAGTSGAGTTARVPVVQNLADVVAQPVKWLWPRRIAEGKLTILAGDPGLGKSLLGIDIAARVTTAGKWPDCDERAPLGGVVVLTAEDDLADTVKPRLEAAGADASKVVALQSVRGRDADGEYERPLDLLRDLDMVEQAIDGVPDCKLVIIDPQSAYFGKTDSHKNAEVRAVLAPLSQLAARRSVAVLAIEHLNKAETKAVYKITGSIGITGAARAVWAVTKDKHDPDGRRRLLLPIKNNLGPDQSGLAFSLSARFGSAGQPCITWEAAAVTTSADEALAPEPQRRGPAPKERDEAERFLCDALAVGPRLAKELEEEALERFDISPRTLKRARKALRVKAYREAIPGPWFLSLNGNSASLAPNTLLHDSLGIVGGIRGERGQENQEGQEFCTGELNGTLGDNGHEGF